MDEEKKKKAAEARNAYAREWRAKNKEKVRANNRRYWERKAERAAAERNEKGEE